MFSTLTSQISHLNSTLIILTDVLVVGFTETKFREEQYNSNIIIVNTYKYELPNDAYEY